ncbi:hypothetical protein NIES2107_28800 [Nostoc carneum NIES-2107]|nr:hypothetical protein NIES2107_28800 [Nostoc carneum NIES-2107]
MLNESNQPSLSNFPLLMSKLYGQYEQERIAALPEILKYGQIGEELLIKIIQTEGGELQSRAINLMLTLSRNKINNLSEEIEKDNNNLESVTKKIDNQIYLLECQSQELTIKIQQLEQDIKNLIEQKNSIDKQKSFLHKDRKIEEDKEKEKIIKEIDQRKKQIKQIRESVKSLLLEFTINCPGYKDIYMISNLDHRFIFLVLKNSIAESLNINIEKVTLNANLSHDLGADEYDGTEVIMAVEQDFDIEITNDDMYKYLKDIGSYPDYTVKAIFDLILLKIST